VVQFAVLLNIQFPHSLRIVEDLLFERGNDLCHESVRLWRDRFGPMFAADIRQPKQIRRRVCTMLRFRRMKTLQMSSSVHAQVHNHFNEERHLVSRHEYKQRRSVALIEWQNRVACYLSKPVMLATARDKFGLD
jgi:transposase-like protein